jgi:carbon storage regulator
MLVLLRKAGEAIVIGGRVLVTVEKVRSQSVSLGITAPEDIRIDRGEIHVLRNAANALACERTRPSLAGSKGGSLPTG